MLERVFKHVSDGFVLFFKFPAVDETVVTVDSNIIFQSEYHYNDPVWNQIKSRIFPETLTLLPQQVDVDGNPSQLEAEECWVSIYKLDPLKVS